MIDIATAGTAHIIVLMCLQSSASLSYCFFTASFPFCSVDIDFTPSRSLDLLPLGKRVGQSKDMPDRQMIITIIKNQISPSFAEEDWLIVIMHRKQ
jgi:hypothetical protein